MPTGDRPSLWTKWMNPGRVGGFRADPGRLLVLEVRMKTFVRKPINRLVAEEKDDPILAPVAPAPAPAPVMQLGPVAGLTVGHAGAPTERAADRMAETAIARLQKFGNRSALSTPFPAGPRTSGALSRLPRTSTPASAVIGRAGGQLDQVTGQAITSRLGRGSRLPEPSRTRMETAFETSLDHVRVHDDTVSASLNDAVSARAFTLGNDIFVGRDVTPANRADEKVLAHEIAHVLTELGNVHRLQRLFQHRADTPFPVQDPRNANQRLPAASKANKNVFPAILWDQSAAEPKEAYRFLEPANPLLLHATPAQGWEAKTSQAPFFKSDWHQPPAPAVTKWFDATTQHWRQGKPPDTHRKAMPDERPAAIVDLQGNPNLQGFPSLKDVPVFVKAKYRPVKNSKKTKGARGPGLRALDRAGRVLMAGVEGNRLPVDARSPKELTPHLATGLVNGVLQVAGNTGTKHVTQADRGRADVSLRDAVDPGERVPGAPGTRARKDALKLRALQSGDYLAEHSARGRGLKELSTALKAATAWQNVGTEGGGSEHGEMKLLQNLHAELIQHPNPVQNEIVNKELGGVKKACGACWATFEAYNRFIGAPIGYKVIISGTHGGFFDGWKPPAVIKAHTDAWPYVQGKFPDGSRINLSGELVLKKQAEADSQYPDDSESEWEEIPT